MQDDTPQSQEEAENWRPPGFKEFKPVEPRTGPLEPPSDNEEAKQALAAHEALLRQNKN